MGKKIGIIEAPLSTGVGLAGVELMAKSLREAGLQDAVGAVSCEAMSEPFLVTAVDPDTSLPDPQAVRKGTVNLSEFGALGERRYASKLLIRRSARGCYLAKSTRIFVKLTIPHPPLVATIVYGPCTIN